MKHIKIILLSGLVLIGYNNLHAYELTNLTRNDPYSYYTTRYRYEFLLNGLRYNLFTGENVPEETFRVTITPLRESATDKIVLDTTTLTNDPFLDLPSIATLPPQIRGCAAGRDFKKRKVPLGDIKGRLNMLALFYDQFKGCPPPPPPAATNRQIICSTDSSDPSTDPLNIKQCPTVQYFNFSRNPNATTNVFNNFIDPENPDSIAKFDAMFPDMETQDTITNCCIPLFINPCETDTSERLGFFTIPLDFKKYAVRFDLDWKLSCDFDVEVNFGFADIRVCNNKFCVVETITFDTKTESTSTGEITVTTVTKNICTPRSNAKFIDLSCFTPIETCTVGGGTCTLFGTNCTCLNYLDAFLMRKVDQVAEELCLDIDDFCTTGIEDIRLGLHWEHPFTPCPDEHGHPLYLFTPFVLVEGSIPTAAKISNRKIFALPLGNNGHGAVGFAAGFNFDYHDFLQIGVDAGLTHFFAREYRDLPMPTADHQAVFFPFSVDACIEPGNNWHVSASILYTEIYTSLSLFLQYLSINHSEDKVTILRDLRREIPILENKLEQFNMLGGFDKLPDFLPNLFRRESKWDFQSLNFGFNYDFCENFGLGFLWETPISGRRTFNVTNLVFSFSAVF